MGKKIEQISRSGHGIDGAKVSYDDVEGRVGAMKIGLRAKPPNWKKLEVLLEKEQKPAKYYLTIDGLLLTVEVHVGSKKLVLNKLDIGRAKPELQRKVLGQLNRSTGLVTSADLAAFDRQHADPEDGAAAVEINKAIDVLQNRLRNAEIMLKANNYSKKTIDKSVEHDKEFREWAKKKGFERFTNFLMAVDEGRGWNSKIVGFLELGKGSGLSAKTLAQLLAAREAGEAPDFGQARREIAKVVNTHMLPRYNKEKLGQWAELAKRTQAEIKALQRKLAALSH